MLLLELVGDIDPDGEPIHLLRLQHRDVRRHAAADIDLLDPVEAPAKPVGKMPREPIDERIGRGDRDPLALQILNRFDSAVGAAEDAIGERRPGHRRDRLVRRAFLDEGHVGSRTKSDIDVAGGERLLQLRRTFETQNGHVEAEFGHDAGLDTDIDGDEAERCRKGLADHKLIRRLGPAPNEDAGPSTQEEDKASESR